MDETRPTEAPRHRGPGISGAVALTLLATFWVATVLGSRDAAPGPRRLDQRLLRLFEKNGPAVRAFALPTNAVLHLLGEQRGSPSVVLATSRLQGPVLFLADEIELERDLPWMRPVLSGSLASIRARVAMLRQAGVARVVLVAVPAKFSVTAQADPSVATDACASLAAKGTAAVLGPTPTCDGAFPSFLYREMVQALSAEPVGLVAPEALFIEETRRGLPVFGYEDTHWNVYGMALAARDVLRAWRGTAAEPVRTGRLPDRPGDLQVMLALPNLPSLRTHPAAEERYDLPAAGPPCAEKVFLLGSSYSLHADGLASLLRQGSGCEVVDLAVRGGRADASFKPLLEQHAHELAGAVVIWEFPFRNLLFLGQFQPPDKTR